MKRFERISGERVLIPVFWEQAAARSVSDTVLHAHLQLPTLPADIVQQWTQGLTGSLIDAGDISFAARVPKTWEGLPQLEQQVHDWAGAQGLDPGLEPGSFSTLGCLGAPFHDDTHGFADQGFCITWMSPDDGLDLVFPHLDERIALVYGTVVMFDACQPHGVVERGARTWRKTNRYFHQRKHGSMQLFLSWDFDLEDLVSSPLPFERFKTMPGSAEGWPVVNGWEAEVDTRSGAWKPRKQ